jgi:TetR/AcrR family transcriptional repressor of bet genes
MPESVHELLQFENRKLRHKDMTPEQMVKVVVDVSLPPLSEESENSINVSVLDGVDKICLPEKKIANLFGQFLSKSANDDEIKPY